MALLTLIKQAPPLVLALIIVQIKPGPLARGVRVPARVNNLARSLVALAAMPSSLPPRKVATVILLVPALLILTPPPPTPEAPALVNTILHLLNSASTVPLQLVINAAVLTILPLAVRPPTTLIPPTPPR